MEGCLEGITDEIRISYLDDVIVYSKTFEKQVENLRTVLRQLRKHGVKLKPSKCSLFPREVCFLGRIVNHSGHTIDPRNTVVVTKLRDCNPKTVGDVRKLTGLLSIKQFSRIAKPLWKLVGAGKKWPFIVRKYEGKVKIIKDEEASIILWPCQLDKWTPGSSRVRYIMLENSSIMLLSVTQKNLVLCPKLCSKNIALCSPDFYCIQHVLITTV